MLVISNLDYGGAERQVVALAEHLNRQDFEPYVCSLSPHVPLVGNPAAWRIPLHIVAKHNRFDLTVAPRLSALLKKLRIDLVHTFLFDAEIAGRLAGRLAGVRAVVGSERNSNYHMPLLHKIMLRLTGRMSHAIVANSRAGKEFTLRTLGVSDANVHVVYNGVDTQRFAPQSASKLRAELALSADARVIGMVASFKPQKNYEMFFQVAARVLSQRPEARFVCVGSALYEGREGSEAYQQEIRQLVDRLGVRDRCLFLGTRADIADVYNSFDVNLLTSSREGTPNVLLEAMASGVPSVVTAIADNAIHVQDGVNGFVVPLNDVDLMVKQVLTLLADEPRRRVMGETARRRACESYSLAAMARSMGDVYTRLLTPASALSYQMN
jgi:glycosyltransferase involved in cell wall biosynthesis